MSIRAVDHVQLAIPTGREEEARSLYAERLKDRGVQIVHDELPFEGKAHCYIADPFGNRLEPIEDSAS